MVQSPTCTAATMHSNESASSLLLEAASGLAALHSRIVTPSSQGAPSEDEEPACASVDSRESPRSPSPALNHSRDISCSTSPKLRGTSFPERLFAMLSDPASAEAVCWLPDGKSFIVTSPSRLAIDVLPRYFGGQRAEFSSFTRKLYWWGFRKSAASRTTKYDSFTHEMFQRDRPELAAEMKGRQMRRRNDGPGQKCKKAAFAAARAAFATDATNKTAAEEPKVRAPLAVPTSEAVPNSVQAGSAGVIGSSSDFKLTSTSAKLLPALNAAALHQALSAPAPAPVSPLDTATASLAARGLLSSVAAPSPSAATATASLGLPTLLDMPTRSPAAAAGLGAATAFQNSPALLAHHQHSLANQRAIASPPALSPLAAAVQQQAAAAAQQRQQAQQQEQTLLVALASIQAARRQQEQQQQQEQQRRQQQQQQQAQAAAAAAAAAASSSQAPVVIHVHHHHVRGGESYTTVSR